jgi:hypothetical protein
VVASLVGVAGSALAATKNGPGTMTILPKQSTAGTGSNNFTLRYTAPSTGGISKTLVQVVVPTVGAPASGFSPAPSAGDVTVHHLTCSSVSTPSFSASSSPPGTAISLVVTCAANQYFSITYYAVTRPG